MDLPDSPAPRNLKSFSHAKTNNASPAWVGQWAIYPLNEPTPLPSNSNLTSRASRYFSSLSAESMAFDRAEFGEGVDAQLPMCVD